MAATIIDGKKIADSIRQDVRRQTEQLRTSRGITPGLAFILVGESPASQSYVRMKGRACEEAGFYSITENLPAGTSERSILELIRRFNSDERLHGILVQLPLPRHISEERIINALDYRKDVDGFHPVNVGRLMTGQDCLRPCTPMGIQQLLIRSGNDPGGKHVVIVGRSNIVGKPLLSILLQKQSGANAVVTIVHTGAKDISLFTRQADILVAAMGRAGSITGDMIRPGAVVIDVGSNRIEDKNSKHGYRFVGDVDFESASARATAITPVPGGVGPMTIAMLLSNTLRAAAGGIYT